MELFRGRGSDPLVWAFFILLTLFMTYPLILHMEDHIPGNLGDPYYNIWVMSWNRHAFLDAGENILDTNIFYPHKRTLYYADPLFLESILNAVLMIVWKNPVFTYNILFLFSFVICGLGMYYLVRHLTGSSEAAVLAGLIYCYFPNKFAHLTHLEMLFFGWMPFVFLFLHKFFKEPKYKYLFGFIFFFALQAASCSYYAVYLTVFVLIFSAYFAYKKGWMLKKHFWIKAAAASALLMAFLLPLFYPYMALSREMHFFRPLEEVKYYSAQLGDFFSVPPWNRTYKNLMAGQDVLEWQVFPGLIPVLLAFCWWRLKKRAKEKRSRRKRLLHFWDVFNAVFFLFISWIAKGGGFDLSIGGREILTVNSIRNPAVLLGLSIAFRFFADRKYLWSRLKNFIRTPFRKRLGPKGQTDEVLSQNFYLFTAVLAALFVMGPVITVFGQEIIEGPYYLFYSFFPGFQGLRVPPRFSVLLMLGLAVIGAWGAAALAGKMSSPFRKRALFLLLGILITVEYISVPVPLAQAEDLLDVPPIYKTIRDLPGKASILKLPMPRDKQYFRETEQMFYSVYHGKRLVNGYSGYFPPGYKIIREAMESFPSEETFALLRDLGVDYLLVQTEGYRPWLAKFAVEGLARSPQFAELIDHRQNDYLYRLIKMESEAEESEKQEPVGRRSLWKGTANKHPELGYRAFDGDLTTAWNSIYFQERGDFFALDLGEKLEIEEVVFYLGPGSLEFPRGYRLEGSADGQNWTRLTERRFNIPRLTPVNIQDFSEYKVEMSFEKIEIRYLKISLVKTHKTNSWSISEIVCR